jgi:predicted lipoprotein with Yx(FWY)xxD motif
LPHRIRVAVVSGAIAVSAVAGPAVAGAATAKAVVIVQVVDRAPFGQMLATKKTGASLYIDPSGPCSGSCLAIWPPLLLPKGKTIPQGVNLLGTVKFGHRLQVTYKGEALYTFASDSGGSVTGDGVGGFVVAAVG